MSKSQSEGGNMKGKVIIRANESGVWYGEIVDHAVDYGWVSLRNALRLWAWRATEGVSCSALAAKGINLKQSTVAPAVGAIIVRNPCEIIEVTPEAEATYELA